MRVFVTGATGYIGFHVACALRRAGHQVWGLVRTPAKASRLARHEVHPVLGDLKETASFRAAAEACSVLVHAAADYETDTMALDRRAVAALVAAARQGDRPKTLVYTSGTWVYGDTGDEPADESAPLAPPRLVAARPASEQMVLQASEVRGLVLRPGCVYGGQGGLTAAWFAGGRDRPPTAALRLVGDGRNHWAMVHVEDLADAYRRAIESELRGEPLNLADGSRTTVGEMAAAAARASGWEGAIEPVPVAEAAKSMGDFAACLALDQHIDAGRAERLLGWRPRHRGFVAGVREYHEAWRAAAG